MSHEIKHKNWLITTHSSGLHDSTDLTFIKAVQYRVTCTITEECLAGTQAVWLMGYIFRIS